MHKEETLSHHSANVAYICSILTEQPDVVLMQAALVHDMAEVYTGDVPFPFKAAHPPMKQYLDNVEKRCLQDWGLYVQLTEEQHQILKAADMLDLVLKAADELAMGNRMVAGMLGRGVEELKTLINAAFPEYAGSILKPIIQELDEWLQTISK